MKKCTIDGCCKPLLAKGLCNSHYRRLQRHGSPMGGGTPNGVPMKWIEDVALPFSGDDCLIWPFSRNPAGYGLVRKNGVSHNAHRVVCIMAIGNPPKPKYEASHICGNGHLGCVNPKHLRWDTRAGNQSDRVGHGTHNRGEMQGSSRLTTADVRIIRDLRKDMPATEAAKRFGVSKWHIYDIRSRRAWAWLD